jgi:ADP-ribosylglycohydrolase
MPRVDPDRAAGALLGLAVAGDAAATESALRLASSLIGADGYDPGSRREGSSDPAAATPIGIAFAGRDEALRDATIADAALAGSDPLDGKVALLHNQVVAWSLTGGPDLVFHHLKDPEWLDDRIEDVVIPATSGVVTYATTLAGSEPGSALTAIAVGLAAFFDADGFEQGIDWAIGLVGANAAAAGALLGARLGATAIPPQRLAATERRREIEVTAQRLAAMAA